MKFDNFGVLRARSPKVPLAIPLNLDLTRHLHEIGKFYPKSLSRSRRYLDQARHSAG